MIADREAEEVHLLQELLRDLWRAGVQVQAGYGQGTPTWEQHRRALEAAAAVLGGRGEAGRSSGIPAGPLPELVRSPPPLPVPAHPDGALSDDAAGERASKGQLVAVWPLLVLASVAAWALLLWGSRHP